MSPLDTPPRASYPVAMMKTCLQIAIGLAALAVLGGAPAAEPAGAADPAKWKLVWADEFDYTGLPDPVARTARPSWREALNIGQSERDAVERTAAREAASRIAQRLPRNEAQKQLLLDDGLWLAQRMSWDVVAREQLLPVLRSLDDAGTPGQPTA